jgi:peptidoglycan/LPS O-acetylase OafA/YrhL
MEARQLRVKASPADSDGVYIPVPVASDRYVKELDGIRAVAIGIVVCAHYQLIPLIPGGFGVTLFFFLSGYLITTLFYSEYRSTNNIDIFRFYARRWLRLTPPLVISVLSGIIFYRVTRIGVAGTPVPIGTTMAALLYYTNYYDLAWAMEPSRVIPFGICWSLAVEEHFYLLWPLIISKNIYATSRILAIIIGACVIIVIWRIVAHYILLFSTDYTYMATDARIDSILYGALLRVLFETPWAPAVVNICKSRAGRTAGLLLLFTTFVIRDDGFRETIRYSLQGIALMPLFSVILLDNPMTAARRVLGFPIIVLVGRLSYSIYLFHLMARTSVDAFLGSPHWVEVTVGGLLVTGFLAYSVFKFVELPIANIRRRLRRKESPVPSVTAIVTPESAQ